jgi:hypothetical protein
MPVVLASPEVRGAECPSAANESGAAASPRQRRLCRTRPVRKVAQVKGRTSQSRHPPNQRVELTPLRGPKIAAFLMAGIGSTACSIYKAAQLTRRPFGVGEHAAP